MTLSTLPQPTFAIRFEGSHITWPKELGEPPKSWSEVSFLSYDTYPFLDDTLWNEVVVTEEGKLYIEYQDLSLVEDRTLGIGYKTEIDKMKLRALDTFTGQITIETYITNDEGEDDYLLVYSLTAVKGMLDSVEIHTRQPVSNKNRKANVEKIQKQIKKTISRESAFWYRNLYKPYRATLRFLFQVVVLIWNTPLVILDKLVRLLTPI